jgi:hypothetical protein
MADPRLLVGLCVDLNNFTKHDTPQPDAPAGFQDYAGTLLQVQLTPTILHQDRGDSIPERCRGSKLEGLSGEPHGGR